MDVLVTSISLSGVLLALTLSVISLVFHWIKRDEHPDITAVERRIQEIKVQHLDLLDKVEHWRRRDNVRRARQGAEDKLAESNDAPQTPAEYKRTLRARALQNGLGINS